MSNIRLLPVLVFGLLSLFVIKLITIGTNLPTKEQDITPLGVRLARTATILREKPNEEEIITGSVPKKVEAPPEEAKAAPKLSMPKTQEEREADEKERQKVRAKMESEGIRILSSSTPLAPNPEERMILEKLRERRGQIEAQASDVDMREAILRAGEQKMEDKIKELRTLEAQNEQNTQKNDPKQRYKSLVVMYENMKPKDAARVFDRLDVKILIDLVGHMNPRKVSEIMAAMDPSAAERLTVALAKQAAQGGDVAFSNDAPPKPEQAQKANNPRGNNGAGSQELPRLTPGSNGR